MGAWESFAMAQVGAAAALAGLLFVGVSVNLLQVLATPGLPERAGETLVVLLASLVAGLLLLTPTLSAAGLGLALLATGLLAEGGVLVLQRRAWRGWSPSVRSWTRQHPGWFAIRLGLGQLATLPLSLAGASLLLGQAGGLSWLMVGAVGTFGMRFLSAWVLLIEIQR